MGRFTFRLPDIGEGIAEAEIVAWHVKTGDRIEEDGRLADLMTDKATVEMESPVAGTVLEVGGDVGDVIAIGSPLVVIETDGAVEGEAAGQSAPESVPEPAASEPPVEAVPDRPAPAAKAPEPEEPTHKEDAPPPPEPDAPRVTPAPPASVPAAPTDKVLASPAVRARARSLGVDLAEIRSAEGGRIRHADLDSFLSYGGARGYAPVGRTGHDETIKVVGLRRRIAENMAASKRRIPHFAYVEECDVTALEQMRADLNAHRGEKPRLTMLPLLIAAACRALPDFPMLNARYDDEANIVTRYGAVHMGMATMTDAGLMVPVIRNAQALNLWQLALEIGRLSEAAREGKAKSEELSGSSFTLTSLGPLGGIASTPVINRPEVAILAPNRIVERPAFVSDGQGGERIEKRKLMNLSISCDHRVVDGYDAAAFVQALKRLIETPVLLLSD